MRELLVESRPVPDGWGGIRVLEYSILIEEKRDGSFLCESYGVRIAERGSGNQSAVRDVTCRAARIDELVDLLARNEVRPGHLLDVVMDWL